MIHWKSESIKDSSACVVDFEFWRIWLTRVNVNEDFSGHCEYFLVTAKGFFFIYKSYGCGFTILQIFLLLFFCPNADLLVTFDFTFTPLQLSTSFLYH